MAKTFNDMFPNGEGLKKYNHIVSEAFKGAHSILRLTYA